MSFRGIMPKPTRNKDETSDFSQMRTVLRESWNTSYQRQLGGLKRVLTPFRAVNNAGDILCRQNYTCGGPNSGYQSRAGLRGLRFGGVHSNCDDTGVPASSCNPKYVYDSSNYTTFLKQQANVTKYNAKSFASDDFNASQSVKRNLSLY